MMFNLSDKYYILNKKGETFSTPAAANKVLLPSLFHSLAFFFTKTDIYYMNRIRKHKTKLMILMGPKVFRMVEKIKKNYNDEYFDMTEIEQDQVAEEIATIIIHIVIGFFNEYSQEELPDLYDLAITNLKSLEEHFVELELYSYAAMIKDSITKLNNDLSTLVEPKL